MINENKVQSKVFFPNLDGLRTIAFLLVYNQHGFEKSLALLNINNSILNRLIDLSTSGGTGVSVFFVLSGFLITYLILTEIEVRGQINVLFFYVRRVLRIWPLYYAVVIFTFVIYPYIESLAGISSNLASSPIFYFTFLSNFDLIEINRHHPGMDRMMQGITWSVSVEEQFYLLWPLLFFFLPKRYYKWIFPIVIITSLLFRFINRGEGYVLYFHSLGVCADLAVGGLCAYYALYSNRFKSLLHHLSKPAIIGIYILGFVWLLYGSSVLNDYLTPLFSRLVSTFFFAFIILEQNFSTHSFYKFSKMKNLTFWGRYTYGLYLLHPIALLIVDIILNILGITYTNLFITFFAVGIAGLLLSLLMSYLSYEFYEKWFLKLKDKFSFIHRNDTKGVGNKYIRTN